MSRRTDGSVGGTGGVSAYMREIASGPGEAETLGHGTENPNFVNQAVGYVYYSPLELPHAYTAYGIIIINGPVGGGNFYVALYDHVNYAPVNRLAVSASTPRAGNTQLQYVPFISPVSLDAGLYFTASEASENANLITNIDDSKFINPAGINNGLIWYREDLGGYAIPPAVATPVQVTDYNSTTMKILRVANV